MDEPTRRGKELRERLRFPSPEPDDKKPGIDREYLNYVNRNIFGEVWCREGLDPKIRSYVTVAILIAQGHMHHLALHLRAAVINGATEAELREVIFHTLIYCGSVLPVEAFRVADEVFESAAPPI